MRADIERAIMRYYPGQTLRSPLDDDTVVWDWDRDHNKLRSLLQDLEQLDSTLRPGTAAAYDIAEEVVLVDGLRLLISYLGPFVAVNAHPLHRPSEAQVDMLTQVRPALQRHGFELLDDATLNERASWLEASGAIATVRTCLFAG